MTKKKHSDQYADPRADEGPRKASLTSFTYDVAEQDQDVALEWALSTAVEIAVFGSDKVFTDAQLHTMLDEQLAQAKATAGPKINARREDAQ